MLDGTAFLACRTARVVACAITLFRGMGDMGTASSTLHPVLPKPGSLLAIGGAAVILAAAIALKLVIDHLAGR